MGHFGELEMANALKHGMTLGLKMSLAINLPPSDPNSPTKLMVASLIDSDERCWKLDLIREIFTDTDVSHITSIHLSKRNIPDKLIWKHYVNGSFTVKLLCG